MCYSKEVQLITSLIILLSCLFFYLFFLPKYSKNKKNKWLVPFLNNVLLVFLCIGGHQFFEFLSLITKNSIVYKTGLIISIFSVYFALKSLEVMVNADFHRKIVYFFILLIAAYILVVPVYFEEFNFYLRHYSVFLWVLVYFLFFVYWNVCAFDSMKKLEDNNSKKAVIFYLLSVADLSFLISAVYIAVGYYYFSVNVCYDTPSIWCTFFVIQALFTPIFLFMFPSMFKRPKNKTINNLKKTLILFGISALIILIFMVVFPLFECLSWKFVFP